MKSADIRQAFLTFFESKQHQVVPSSSLIPDNDPTLLFTNAGMVQFKDVFLGADKRTYSRAASSQRCVRAGGKHNDLENVGYTARHHTFFEMLGNFSFGDYFKRDAIFFAWEFLTKTLGLPEEKLWITVHISDDEAADIWQKEVGVSPSRFSRLDEDNFWQMGDTGPCGPSSEIFYDHGDNIPGGPPGSENDDLDRYIEIWNLVFMQYERQANGDLIPLPKPSVDTGMGLERIAAVMQGVHNNYDIDLFQALLHSAADIVGEKNTENKSLRVIADHIRSCSFLICDGVMPSNEGRGYVLRRIIRRAVRHGHKLGKEGLFFYALVPALVKQMSAAYPELATSQSTIEQVLKKEEEQFAKTLENGMSVLDARLSSLEGNVISGDIVFTLYDTYGFPVDLTNDIARERGLSLDMDAYNVLMAKQKKQSKEGGNFKLDYTNQINSDVNTEFTGYHALSGAGNIQSLFINGEHAETLKEGDSGAIVLDKTPLYAESGGQVGDIGELLLGNNTAVFRVDDCRKAGNAFLHIGQVIEGSFSNDDTVLCRVNEQARLSTAKNHSATHLLHAALRDILGEHVTQKGSLVNAERLRFDFSHPESLTAEQLSDIETAVNRHIQANTLVTTEVCDMETAKAKGAMALFGEKYSDDVRVLSMGVDNFSIELCGGTHVTRTGDIGLFNILSESGISSGVRRIEAVTGTAALAEFQRLKQLEDHLLQRFKSSSASLSEKIEHTLEQAKITEKSLSVAKAKLASASADEWLQEATEVAGIQVLIKQVDGLESKSLRDLVDRLKSKLGTSAVVIANVNDGKIALIAGVSKDAINVVKAGDLVKHVAQQIGGKGGGRPDMAQGGGTDIDALPAALASILEFIAN